MRLQLAGAVLVIAALLAAELAAMALAAFPGSGILWKLNLDIFRAINATFWIVDFYAPLSHSWTIGVLAALLAILITAFWYKNQLVLAVLSNCAFIYCGALAYVSFAPYGGGAVASASLLPVAVEFDFGSVLVLYLLVASLCGAAASHLSYFARVLGRPGTASGTIVPPGREVTPQRS